MSQWLRNLKVTRVALCAQGMNQEAEIALYKSAEEPSDKEAGMADNPTTDTEVAAETVDQADYDAVVAERDTLQARLAELETPAEEIDKADLPAEVVKALEENTELKARIEKMEAEQRAESFLAKARSDYEHVAPAEDLAPVLELLDRVAPEQAQVLDRCLKAANARISDGGLFTELGSASEAPAGNAQVDALIAKAMEGGLSRADAIRKVFSEHPDLYPATPA